MSAPHLRLHEEHDPLPGVDAAGSARLQGGLAEASLYRHPDVDWLRLPWRSLDAMVDGIGDGEVWFVGGFSGAGKTTWLMNLVRDLLPQGKRVYYVGTETKPHELRTRLACVREGIYAGDVMTGRAARTYERWEDIRGRLVADIRRQTTLGPREEFFVCPVQRVNAGVLSSAFDDAKAQGADLLIIDHIDHIEHGGGRGGWDDAKMLAHLVLDLAQETGMRTMVATQFNNEGAKADLLGLHRPPQPHHVFMGGKKRQISWGFLGLFRPLREDISADDIKNARLSGVTKPLLEPNVLAVSCMKHRNHGSHEGDVVKLAFDRGRLVDLPERDQYSTGYDDVRRV